MRWRMSDCVGIAHDGSRSSSRSGAVASEATGMAHAVCPPATRHATSHAIEYPTSRQGRATQQTFPWCEVFSLVRRCIRIRPPEGDGFSPERIYAIISASCLHVKTLRWHGCLRGLFCHMGRPAKTLTVDRPSPVRGGRMLCLS